MICSWFFIIYYLFHICLIVSYVVIDVSCFSWFIIMCLVVFNGSTQWMFSYLFMFSYMFRFYLFVYYVVLMVSYFCFLTVLLIFPDVYWVSRFVLIFSWCFLEFFLFFTELSWCVLIVNAFSWFCLSFPYVFTMLYYCLLICLELSWFALMFYELSWWYFPLVFLLVFIDFSVLFLIFPELLLFCFGFI